jgi:hypothetical protein
MAVTNLGRVCLVPAGEYNPATEYVFLDLVYYNGVSYCSLVTQTGVTPTNDGVNWQQAYQPLYAEELEYAVGSPAGAYADLAALNTADPDHAKIYITLGDGKWCYYDTGTSAFVAGDVYQAVSVADQSVSFNAIIGTTIVAFNDEAIWEIGSLELGTGIDNPSTTRIRTKNKILLHKGDVLVPVSGYRVAYYLYADNYPNNYVSDVPWSTSRVVMPDTGYYRVIISLESGADTPVNPTCLGVKLYSLASPAVFLSGLGRNIPTTLDLSPPIVNESALATVPAKLSMWEIGQSINPTSGERIASAGRMVTRNYFEVGPNRVLSVVSLDADINVIIGRYDSTPMDPGFSYSPTDWADRAVITTYQDAEFVVLLVRYSDDRTITDENATAILSSIEVNVSESTAIMGDVLFEDVGAWEYGSVYNEGGESPGQPYPSMQRIRFADFYPCEPGNTVTSSDPNVIVSIACYDNNRQYLLSHPFGSSPQMLEHDGYIRILIAKQDHSMIDDGDFMSLISAVTFKTTDYKIKSYISPYLSRIRNLENGASVGVPSYFIDNLNTAVSSSRIDMMDAGHAGDTFIFFSDLHWINNSKTTPALVSEVTRRLNVKKIFDGGDAYDSGTKAEACDYLADITSAYKPIGLYCPIVGNHDNNLYSGDPEQYLSTSEIYALHQKHLDGVVNFGGDCYYYFDNSTAKTRYICMDTGGEGENIAVDQMTWLENTLNAMPDGYRAVIFAHLLYQTTGSWSDVPLNLVLTNQGGQIVTDCDAFNVANANKKVFAIFGGHTHRDFNAVSASGIQIILITTNSINALNGEPASFGSVTETAFDIVTLDYNSNTIKCRRVGRNNDRIINAV